MGSQGAWTRWETEERKLSWAEIWKYTPWQLQFILRAVYDVLPTPTNLHRWGLVEDPTCQQCDRAGSLEHILSSCEVALAQGRYTWRHDQVLRKLADTLEREWKKAKVIKKGPTFIQFQKEGQTTSKSTSKTNLGILGCAGDWEMRVDLGGKKLAFPEVVETALRPDIVLVSSSKKKLVMVELTVPWETRCESAHERKRTKYAELADECGRKGWQAWNFPVEVGCRGFPSQSCWRMLGALGITGKMRKTAIKELGKEAERASRWLWIRRGESSWKPTVEE